MTTLRIGDPMAFIEDQLRAVVQKKEETGRDWCVTLESKTDPDRWVQLTWQFVNLHYPFRDDPAKRLELLGWSDASLDLDTWDADTYVTFSHCAGDTISDVACFVRRYITEILNESILVEDWDIEEYAI